MPRFLSTVAASLLAVTLAGSAHAGAPKLVPTAAADIAATSTPQTALLAGGCFWGVQAVYQHVEGVIAATSGYAGGSRETATYDATGSGRTGHAETVRILFDPQKVSYAALLQIFFSTVHDPTQINRQGPDVGPQYRSAIFPTDAEQANVARAYIDQLTAARIFKAPIATTIERDKVFYVAEREHQNYLHDHPGEPYIVIHERPKLDGLRTLFPEHYRPHPVLESK
jgi:peptide-methionine (S)-S-oxide reductase